MLKFVDHDEAVAHETMSRGGAIRPTRRYFGHFSGRDDLSGEALSADVHRRTIEPHFHDVDQFQILLGAPGGVYQRTPLAHITLHYTDAYKTYGPIVGADPPVGLFTFRPTWSSVTAYMPADREKLVRRGRRHLLRDFPTIDLRREVSAKEVSVETAIARDTDGLEASVVIAGPLGCISLQDTLSVNGQFVFVADGEIRCNSKVYGPRTIGWQERGEYSMDLVAGAKGCRIFVLRFPLPPSTEQKATSSPSSSTR